MLNFEERDLSMKLINNVLCNLSHMQIDSTHFMKCKIIELHKFYLFKSNNSYFV